MIDQLVMLILQTPNEDVRSQALSNLSHLAQTSECEGWAADSEIFEALLEAMSSIYTAVQKKDEVTTALEVMEQDFQAPAVRKVFGDWLDGSPVKDKLASLHNKEEEGDPSHLLNA